MLPPLPVNSCCATNNKSVRFEETRRHDKNSTDGHRDARNREKQPPSQRHSRSDRQQTAGRSTSNNSTQTGRDAASSAGKKSRSAEASSSSKSNATIQDGFNCVSICDLSILVFF